MATNTLKQHAPDAASANLVRNAMGGRVMVVSLADPQMRARVNALQARVTVDSATSKRFLNSVGIMNRSGKTAKNFGG